MRLIASIAGAYLALSSVSAEAARFLVTGEGHVPGSIIYDNLTGRGHRGLVDVSFSFVTDGVAGRGAVYEFDDNGMYYHEGVHSQGYGQTFLFSTSTSGFLSGTSGIGYVRFSCSPRAPNGGFGGFSGEGKVTFTIRAVEETRPVSNAGFTVTAVPEPAIWMSMIGGFALVGSSLRRRTVTKVHA